MLNDHLSFLAFIYYNTLFFAAPLVWAQNIARAYHNTGGWKLCPHPQHKRNNSTLKFICCFFFGGVVCCSPSDEYSLSEAGYSPSWTIQCPLQISTRTTEPRSRLRKMLFTWPPAIKAGLHLVWFGIQVLAYSRYRSCIWCYNTRQF